MLSVSNLSVQFGKRILFDEVSTTFNNGNCYGIIGANGSGKSTFLKIISGKMEPTSGHVSLEAGKRMSVLEQNHNLYDESTVLETILMGNKPLFDIKTQLMRYMPIIQMKMLRKLVNFRCSLKKWMVGMQIAMLPLCFLI